MVEQNGKKSKNNQKKYFILQWYNWHLSASDWYTK